MKISKARRRKMSEGQKRRWERYRQLKDIDLIEKSLRAIDPTDKPTDKPTKIIGLLISTAKDIYSIVRA